MEQERVKLQEAEVRRIKNLEEAVELSSQQLQSFKKKKVAIKMCFIYKFVTNELLQPLFKILLFLQLKLTQPSDAYGDDSNPVSCKNIVSNTEYLASEIL